MSVNKTKSSTVAAPPPKGNAPDITRTGSQPAKAAPTPAPVIAGPVAALFRSIDWWAFGITTLIIFLGYWWTLAPDLTLED